MTAPSDGFFRTYAQRTGGALAERLPELEERVRAVRASGQETYLATLAAGLGLVAVSKLVELSALEEMMAAAGPAPAPGASPPPPPEALPGVAPSPKPVDDEVPIVAELVPQPAGAPLDLGGTVRFAHVLAVPVPRSPAPAPSPLEPPRTTKRFEGVLPLPEEKALAEARARLASLEGLHVSDEAFVRFAQRTGGEVFRRLDELKAFQKSSRAQGKDHPLALWAVDFGFLGIEKFRELAAGEGPGAAPAAAPAASEAAAARHRSSSARNRALVHSSSGKHRALQSAPKPATIERQGSQSRVLGSLLAVVAAGGAVALIAFSTRSPSDEGEADRSGGTPVTAAIPAGHDGPAFTTAGAAGPGPRSTAADAALVARSGAGAAEPDASSFAALERSAQLGTDAAPVDSAADSSPAVAEYPQPRAETAADATAAPRADAASLPSEPAVTAQPAASTAEDSTALAKGAPAAAAPRPKGPGEVVDRYPSGKVRERYHIDKNGRRDGTATAFLENGKVSRKASYKADLLAGAYEEFYPSGARSCRRSYKSGLLHGRSIDYDQAGHVTSELVFIEGHLSYTKTPEQIAQGLAAITALALPLPAGTPTVAGVKIFDAGQQTRAVKRLLAYRLLCDVPLDVTLDYSEAEKAAGGVKLLEVIGHLDHTPAQPTGMPDDLYKLGYKGTSEGNLYEGDGDILSAVDRWIDDADGRNSVIVGHRRWSLDPAMQHVAYCKEGKFAVMYAHDGFGKQPGPVRDGLIAWPPRGYCPTTLFRHDVTWSTILDQRVWAMPTDVKVKVFVADAAFKRVKEATVTEVNVNTEPYGAFHQCVTFRVDGTTAPGGRYWVVLEGVKDAHGDATTVEYPVEFYKG